MEVNVCTNPDVMQVMYWVNIFLNIAKILLPLIIIVISSLDLAKTVSSGNASVFKECISKMGIRLASAVIIFFVPTILNVTFGLVADNFDFLACFDNATKEGVHAALVARAELAMSTAESSLDSDDYDYASYTIGRIDDSDEKDNLKVRLANLKEVLNDMKTTLSNIVSSDDDDKEEDALTVSGYSSTGTGTCSTSELTYEPDPSSALSCWSNIVSTSNFVYPTDSNTGLPLGAWPSNYSSIPTSIKVSKKYAGSFIMPLTPSSGVIGESYEHGGIDITTSIGTPVYAPVSGYVDVSEWGHTVNKAGNETAYSVTIYLDSPTKVTLGGNTYKIGVAFLTHLSGIIYRCGYSYSNYYSCGTNYYVNAGDLIGFTGIANGSPHLHLSYYVTEDNDQYTWTYNLTTTEIRELYGLSSSGSAVKAGG